MSKKSDLMELAKTADTDKNNSNMKLTGTMELFDKTFVLSQREFNNANLDILAGFTTNGANGNAPSFNWAFIPRDDKNKTPVNVGTVKGYLKFDFIAQFKSIWKTATTDVKSDDDKKFQRNAYNAIYGPWYETRIIDERKYPTKMIQMALGKVKRNNEKEAKVAACMAAGMDEKLARSIIYSITA